MDECVKYDMPETLRRQLAGRAEISCLYCSNLPDTTEHVMPAAFGYFKNSPMLPDHLCSDCKVSPPMDAAFAFHPHEREWVERLVQQVWPTVTISAGTLLSNVIERPLLKFQVTDRYHRAFAKLGFHYFLSQFSSFSGREEMFASIRQFIVEDSDNAESRVNSFITERTTPLLSPIAKGLTPPDDWRAHVIAAEVRPGACVAHVQMFITREWKSPIRTIVLAKSKAFTSHEAAGHLFLYHPVDKQDGYAGEAKALSIMPI
jgi:hypothetical protein